MGTAIQNTVWSVSLAILTLTFQHPLNKARVSWKPRHLYPANHHLQP